MISFQYRLRMTAEAIRGAHMERTGIPKSTHQERPIFTWNGFVALASGSR